METKLTVHARPVYNGLGVEVGPADPTGKRRFLFGMTAEAFIGRDYNGRDIETTVTIGGIGSHDTATGRIRAAAYLKACDLADEAEGLLGNGTAPEVIIETFDGMEVSA